MMDFMLVILVVFFFIMSAGLLKFCQALMEE